MKLKDIKDEHGHNYVEGADTYDEGPRGPATIGGSVMQTEQWDCTDRYLAYLADVLVEWLATAFDWPCA